MQRSAVPACDGGGTLVPMLSGQESGDEAPEPTASGDGAGADGGSEEDPSEPGAGPSDSAVPDGDGPAVFLTEPAAARAGGSFFFPTFFGV
ncbi:hypothetical protein ADL26_05465, partial [Thermoactinomyces vulgaris]